MWLDITCAIILILNAIAGYRRGILLSVLLLLATCAAIALSRALAPIFGSQFVPVWHYWSGTETSVALCGLLLLSVPLFRFVIRVMYRVTVGSQTDVGHLSAIAGACFSAATVALLLWAVLCGLLAIGSRLSLFGFQFADFSHSYSVKVAQSVYLLGKSAIPHHHQLWEVVDTLHQSNTPNSTKLGLLVQLPAASSLQDAQLVQSIRNMDWGAVAAHPGAWQLLTDPEVVFHIRQLATQNQKQTGLSQ